VKLPAPMIAALLAGAAVLFAGVGTAPASRHPMAQTPGAHAASNTVSLRDNRFSPSSSLTSAGSVRFVWRGGNRHNVIFSRAPGSNPRSCGLRRSGTCTRRLRRSGTYQFVCSIHSGMSGKIRRR